MRNVGWKALFGYALLAIILLLAFEVGFRLFGFEPRKYTRPYHPVLISGAYFGSGTKSSSFEGHISHPSTYGYDRLISEIFIFDHQSRKIDTLADRTDFVFDHLLSRYTAADIDRIMCSKPDSLNIFVVGGSAAQGVGASSTENTWHSLLEGTLRRLLQNPNIHVFNAAIGGFNTLQERLTYELAVSPREPDIVLVLDGFNDVVLPLTTLVRPGDPYQSGIRFTQFYGNSLIQSLAEASALAEFLFMQPFYHQRNIVWDRIEHDEMIFGQYRDAIADAYMRNTEAILEDCELRSRECLVALQPFRAISHAGADVALDEPDIVSSRRWAQIYDYLRKRMGVSLYADRYIDLSGVFSAKDRLDVYTDYVHFNDKGNVILAEALVHKLTALIETGDLRTGRRPKSCQQ